MTKAPIHPSVSFKKAIENFTQDEVAEALGLCRVTVNKLSRGKTSFTPDTAVRCAKVLGTTAFYWLRLQMTYDIWEARQAINIRLLKKLR